MHYIHHGGQLSDKQKQELSAVPIKSRYAIYYRNKLYWVYAYTEAQAKLLVKLRQCKQMIT